MSDTNSLQQRSHELTQEFSKLGDWEARYKRIIEYGKALADMPEDLKTEDRKVKGCQSQVWLDAKLTDSGLVEFKGDSDALIVKGLVALLLKVYSGQKPQDILNFPPEFLKTMGFEGNLSPSRSNGLHSMLKQIRNYALAFQFLAEQKK